MSIDATAIIREESDRLAAVLSTADPELKVPTCPGWTAADLLWHATEVPEFWATILEQRAQTEEEVEAIDAAKVPRPVPLEALLERRTAATASLLEQLEARTDDELVWFWYSQEQNIGVIRRMQTHETTIHRVDAELTVGRPVTPITPEVALAGLDHVLRVMWPAGIEWIPEWARTEPVAVVEIAPVGGPSQELLISRWSGTRPRDGRGFDAAVGRLLENPVEAAELPRARVTGAPLALDLWAWGREMALDHLADGAFATATTATAGTTGTTGTTGKVEILGDPEAVAQMESLISEGHD